MPEVGLLMTHVLFGVLGTIVAVAVFFDVLNLSRENIGRIRLLCLAALGLFVLSYLVGGYWYVVHYTAEKTLIKAGPWPWAHNYFMEVKEHLFFMLLLLALYLPFLVYSKRILEDAGLKVLTLAVLSLMVIIGLTMDGFGAIIAMSAKVSGMAKLAAAGLGG